MYCIYYYYLSQIIIFYLFNNFNILWIIIEINSNNFNDKIFFIINVICIRHYIINYFKTSLIRFLFIFFTDDCRFINKNHHQLLIWFKEFMMKTFLGLRKFLYFFLSHQ